MKMKVQALNFFIAALLGILLGIICPVSARAQQTCDGSNGSQLGARYDHKCYIVGGPTCPDQDQECEQDFCNVTCPGGYIFYCIGIGYCGQDHLSGCGGYTCTSPGGGK